MRTLFRVQNLLRPSRLLIAIRPRLSISSPRMDEFIRKNESLFYWPNFKIYLGIIIPFTETRRLSRDDLLRRAYRLIVWLSSSQASVVALLIHKWSDFANIPMKSKKWVIKFYHMIFDFLIKAYEYYQYTFLTKVILDRNSRLQWTISPFYVLMPL